MEREISIETREWKLLLLMRRHCRRSLAPLSLNCALMNNLIISIFMSGGNLAVAQS
jgi:hypothetical protein